jgi:hypothetical protein
MADRVGDGVAMAGTSARNAIGAAVEKGDVYTQARQVPGMSTRSVEMLGRLMQRWHRPGWPTCGTVGRLPGHGDRLF